MFNLKEYMIIGGMPEAVSSWIIDKDPQKFDKIQKEILKNYNENFLPDVGLLRHMLNIDTGIIIRKNRIFTECDGALTKKLVEEELANLHNSSSNVNNKKIDKNPSIKFSSKNLKFDGKVLNVPYFMIGELNELIKLVC